MGIFRYNYRSEVLGMQTDITITYPSANYTFCSASPEKAQTNPFAHIAKPYVPGMKFQTVYVLHGGGDDDTTLHRLTRLERYAQQNNVMTVTPQVNDSFFLNTAYGIDYFTYLTEELPVVVRSLFASSEKREDNFVIGMAMGGNGALQLAMRRPDLYAACVDLSGGIGCSLDTENLLQQLKTITHLPKLQGAFGPVEKVAGSVRDLAWIAEKNMREKVDVPALFLAVGKDDFIRDVVRKDRDALQKLGYPFTYEEPEGYGHDWDFWDAYMKKALCEWLPLKR